MTIQSSIRVTVLWIFVFCKTPCFIFSQVPNIQFEKITSQDGLPSNAVMFATKDNKGFMWFGTRRCPTRFDGNTFRDFLDLETIFVTGIAADRYNNVWVATDQNGICKINSKTQKLEVIAKNPKAPQTGHFFIDSFGKGWYSDWFGVHQIDLETHEVKDYPFRPTTYVWIKASFIEDGEKNLWIIGSDNGLFKYDRENDQLIGILGTDAEKEEKRFPIVFSKATLDNQGMIWIGTHNYGLIKFDPLQETFEQFLAGENRKIILSVAAGTDDQGNQVIWFGDTEGVGVFRPDQEEFYRFQGILPNTFRVDHIFNDKENGILWVCTSEGILKYNPKNNLFKTINLPEGLVRFPVAVNKFLQDKNDPSGNTVWLGLSHSGIIKWNKADHTFELKKIPQPESMADIRWMQQLENGNIWIGANQWSYKRPGIWEYNPKTDQFITSPLSRLANKYFSVPFFMYGFFDQQDKFWIGNSDEGIRILDRTQSIDITFWDSLTQAETLIKGNNLINDMLLARDGKVWLATYKGIYFIHPETKEFINADMLKQIDLEIDPAVNTLHEDHEGNIWAARWGSVTKSNQEGILELSIREGLADRENKGVVEDGFGNIWMGNFEGLHYFNPQTQKLLRFTINEGLTNNNTLNRLAIVEGNQLLVGQKNGFNILDVNQLNQKEDPRKIEISIFKIHDQEFIIEDYSKTIRLKRKDNSFSLDFTSLNFSKKQDNQYAYFLEGYDEDWVDNGTNHLINYTNLDPGNYTLHLKTGNTLGEWHTDPFQLEINILPAFYETWWFRVGFVLLMLQMFYSFFRYRINQLMRIQKVRDSISADLHDEIGSSLSSISLMGILAKNNVNEGHPAIPFLEKIVDESRIISSSLDDIVWNINPQNDELSHLIARMLRYASEILEAKGINYELDVKDDFQNIKLSMESRRDFYLIFKEAINNLVKYADCDLVKIKIRPVSGRLMMLISDNGKGFDPSILNERNGLKNMKKRTSKLKGNISIDSKPGMGTSIKLDIPIQ